MPKWYSKEEALQKLQRYCAYQDRCHQEVRQKLWDMNVYPDWQEEIIVDLIEENFLNEERFARSFARGKFRIKKWGKRRIGQALKQKGVSAYCIQKGLSEIDPGAYQQALEGLLLKKAAATRAADDWAFRKALASFAIRKGYETGLVWETVKRLFP